MVINLVLCQQEGQDRYTVDDIAGRLDSIYQEDKKKNPRGAKDQFELRHEMRCVELAQALGARCLIYPDAVVFDWTGNFEHTDRHAELASSK